MLAVIGFPRGGTRYATAVLKKLMDNNHAVFHEMLGTTATVDHRLIYFIDGKLNIDNIDDLCCYDVYSHPEKTLSESQVILGGPKTRRRWKQVRTPEMKAEEDRSLMVSYATAKWSHIIHIRRNPFHVISTWSKLWVYPNPTGPLPFFSESGKKSIDYPNKLEHLTALYLEYDKRMESVADVSIYLRSIRPDLRNHMLQCEYCYPRLTIHAQTYQPDAPDESAKQSSKKHTGERLSQKDFKSTLSPAMWEKLKQFAEKHNYKVE